MGVDAGVHPSPGDTIAGEDNPVLIGISSADARACPDLVGGAI